MKKLFFVGAGAVGSYIGAFLSRAGHAVTFVDPWAEQVEAIKARGIAVMVVRKTWQSRSSQHMSQKPLNGTILG